MSEKSEVVQTSNKPKYTLLAIIFVSVLPLASAYFMYFTGIGIPDNTVNTGGLLAKPLSVETLVTQEYWQRMTEERKWRILLPLPEQCDEACQEHFYVTRQVHIRLGEKGIRVERFAINHSGLGEEAWQVLGDEHPLLQRVDVTPRAWRSWSSQIPELEEYLERHFYLLVDQEGLAMMVYDEQHGNDLLKDIKRALKFSIDFQ